MTSLLFGTEQEDGFARGTFCHIRSAADVLNEQENSRGDSSWLGSPGIVPPCTMRVVRAARLGPQDPELRIET